MRRASLAIALVVLGALAPSIAGAQVRDPTLEWRTLHTEHFDIHYYVPLGLLARRVASVGERAHGTLSSIFGFEPSERIQIVLTDDSDSANGSATALPYDTIRLYAEPPEDLSTLSEYDDWLATLVTHEGTHIFHLDQASGVASILNAILGKVYMPNHVAPRWFQEGIAVWQETEQTSGGRLRSTQWDMWLRMDALEDRFWGFDQVWNDADRWPHGNAAYLYGSFFIRYIADRFGREAIATMMRDYGDSVLPYGMNRVAQRATGLTFTELWADFLAERRAHDELVQEGVDALGRREGERITTHGEMARAPRFLRDGRMIYMRADNRSRPRLVIVDPRTGAEGETLARLNEGGEAGVHPDGSCVFFSRVDVYRDIYSYADLFRRDLRTGVETRLTEGLRAREPDISPDGRHVVFTITRAGTSRLMIADSEDVGRTMRELVGSDRFDLVYTPRFSPDGRSVVFSRWSAGGYRDVHIVDVESGRVEALMHDRAQDTGPVFSPDGRVVYFSSDRTGIANIYAYHLASGVIRQVTNVVAGAYQPAISADGSTLVYVGYTSWGWDLFRMDDVTPDGFREAEPFVDTRPAGSDPVTFYETESESYDPLPTLYPRHYMVDLGQDSFGPQLGVSIEGEDVVQLHSWALRLGFGLTRGDVQVDASYAYNRSPLGVTVRGFRYVGLGGGLSLNGEDVTWPQNVFGGDVGLSYVFPRAFRYDVISLSYAATEVLPLEPWTYVPDPNTPSPVLPEWGFYSTLRFGWGYSDVERYAYDISPSNGRSIAMGVAVSDPILGSQYRSVTLNWSITQYVPLGAQHVLALRYGGGISGGDNGRRSVFGVGGFPTVSPIEGLQAPSVLGGVALRGYPTNSRVGVQMHLLQLEYRFPIWRFNGGPGLLPLYFNRVHGTLFCDTGDAFSGDFDISTFRVGIGAELHFDFTVFYVLGFTLRVGYAYGLMEGGIHQVYAHLGVGF